MTHFFSEFTLPVMELSAGPVIMAPMELKRRFRRWLDEEIGSAATPALRRHLGDHGYRLFSCVEHAGTVQQEVYHPDRGFYRAAGTGEAEALLGIMRQIWLVDALSSSTAPDSQP